MIKLTLQFKGKTLKIFPVKGDRVKIGRDAHCDIVIDNLALSPLHAIIEIENDEATIVDKSEGSEGSEETGIVVNANKIKQHKLDHNDLIYIGKYSLKVTHEEIGDSILQDPEPERETASTTFPAADKTHQGWLQIMSGPKLGRTIKLDNAMVRIGMTGKTCAMITCREDKYYIAHLDGDPKTQVARRDIGEQKVPLTDGDMLNIGETQMMFFLE